MALDNLYHALQKGISLVKVDVALSLKNKGRYATGKTARALRTEIVETDKGFIATLYGPSHINYLEDGRGPTRRGASSANPPLLDLIKEWMSAKGIVGNPWAIVNKLHKQGYKGKPGAISDGLKGKKEDIKREISLASRLDIKAEVLNAIK